jgi:hypothetical protein
MGDGGAHPDQCLAFEATAHAFHLARNRCCAKTSDPAARDLIRLPRRIVIHILNLMHAARDHLADEA